MLQLFLCTFQLLVTAIDMAVVFPPKRVLTEASISVDFPPNRVLLEVLDALEEVMTGTEGFDRREFHQLVLALRKFDPDLFESQERGWRGLILYYQEGGGEGDTWGGNPSK